MSNPSKNPGRGPTPPPPFWQCQDFESACYHNPSLTQGTFWLRRSKFPSRKKKKTKCCPPFLFIFSSNFCPAKSTQSTNGPNFQNHKMFNWLIFPNLYIFVGSQNQITVSTQLKFPSFDFDQIIWKEVILWWHGIGKSCRCLWAGAGM